MGIEASEVVRKNKIVLSTSRNTDTDLFIKKKTENCIHVTRWWPAFVHIRNKLLAVVINIRFLDRNGPTTS